MAVEKRKGLDKALKGRFACLGEGYAVGGERLPYPLDPSWLLAVKMAAARVGIACALEDPMAETARRWSAFDLGLDSKLFKDALRAAFGKAGKSERVHWWRLARKSGGREAYAVEFVYANVSLGSASGKMNIRCEKGWLFEKMPSLPALLDLSKNICSGAVGELDGEAGAAVAARMGDLLDKVREQGAEAQKDLQCGAVSCFASMGMALPEFWAAFKDGDCWTNAQMECLESGWSEAERGLFASMLPKARCAAPKPRRGI